MRRGDAREVEDEDEDEERNDDALSSSRMAEATKPGYARSCSCSFYTKILTRIFSVTAGTVEGWLVAKVLELLGAGVEGAGGRIPYWASHGLFGGRDLKWERGEEKLVEYQEDWIDWIDWRMGREERGVGGRRDVLALNAGGWAPERGMMELCGVGELRVPNLVVNVRRPLVDVVLWREWVGGGEGGRVWDDVKFLRSVIGIFKKWRAVGEEGGGFGGDGFEVLGEWESEREAGC